MDVYGKVLLFNVALTAVIVAIIAAARGEPLASAGTAYALLIHVLIQFVIVTLFFALAKRFQPTPWSAAERYVKVLKPYLPWTQRDDIGKELLENLRAEMQEREHELGRPLRTDEVNAILDRHGHPLLAAGGYRWGNRSLAFGRRLIGPALFPFYLGALALNIGITTALFVAALLAGKPFPLPQFLFPIVIQLGVVTLVFALLEVFLPKHPRAY